MLKPCQIMHAFVEWFWLVWVGSESWSWTEAPCKFVSFCFCSVKISTLKESQNGRCAAAVRKCAFVSESFRKPIEARLEALSTHHPSAHGVIISVWAPAGPSMPGCKTNATSKEREEIKRERERDRDMAWDGQWEVPQSVTLIHRVVSLENSCKSTMVILVRTTRLSSQVFQTSKEDRWIMSYS